MSKTTGTSVVVSRPTLGRWRTRALEVAGTGPVFVLLHGFGDHAGTWVPVLDALAGAGAHAVALDLPGYGEADPAFEGPALPQLDEFLRAAVERWTVDGVAPVVVGNSLGGLVAIRAGQDPTSGVAAIVPVSPAGYGHAWFLDALERYSWLNPLMFVPVVPMNVFRRLTAAGFSWAASGGGAAVLPGIATAAAAQFRLRSDVKRIFGTAPALLAEIRAAAREPVVVRTLIVWGLHDRLTLVSGVERLQQQARDADVLVLEDCGHCAQVTRPDLVVGALLAFTASFEAVG